uniref:DUF1281 domain-containing protein n=1 Tax=Klebsiella oxytoca TaxID=571 RepID=UPI001F3E54A5|nr:DUF1281 domain-containing protein [Klebsiella oxytoca]
MPNWCANRLMFNGINNSDALKTWIAEGGLSLHRRARKEGIQLFLAGCAGRLRPMIEQPYAPYPQLVSYGAAADDRPSVHAYSDWLEMFMAGAVMNVETCLKLHQCWLDSHIAHARWDTLSEREQSVIRQLYQQKSFDWGTVSGLHRWMTGGTACATQVLPHLLPDRWNSSTCCRRVWVLR